MLALHGKYALENGTERARRRFQSFSPNLTESTLRNFKKAYRERIEHKRKQDHPQPVTAIKAQPRDRPLILLELDRKLLHYLRSLRSKDGVLIFM